MTKKNQPRFVSYFLYNILRWYFIIIIIAADVKLRYNNISNVHCIRLSFNSVIKCKLNFRMVLFYLSYCINCYMRFLYNIKTYIILCYRYIPISYTHEVLTLSET